MRSPPLPVPSPAGGGGPGRRRGHGVSVALGPRVPISPTPFVTDQREQFFLVDLQSPISPPPRPQLFSKALSPGQRHRRARTCHTERAAAKGRLEASLVRVPARSSPAQNRSRRCSVTYICAGAGSPGPGGRVGVAGGLSRGAPPSAHPSRAARASGAGSGIGQRPGS